MRNRLTHQGILYGLVITIPAAIVSWFAAPLIPGLNAAIFGLILGVFLGNLFKLPDYFSEGIKFSSSKNLEFAIVLMAFEINLSELIKVGLPIFVTVVSSIMFILIATLFLSKRLSCPGANGWLIGFGTAICGSAAITAIGPVITKDKTQIGISLTVINILGALGIFAVPVLIPLLEYNNLEAGVLVGGSLHSMGHVVGASALFNDDIRNIALSVKLVRIALLTPALILFSNIINKKQNATAKFSLKLPAYLIIFILISLVVSFVDIPKNILAISKFLSTFALVVAMVAIGMNISIRNLILTGVKALGFGAIVFALFLLILTFLIHALF
jgi:uncharacterized integral membrane protein (TIGR00698 family)